MRILMLVPYPTVRGAIPSITRILGQALERQACEITCEPWGRHVDRESFPQKLAGRTRDIAAIKRQLRYGTFDMMLVHTALDALTLTRDLPLLLSTRGLRPKTALHLHGSFSDRLVAPGWRLFKAASRALIRLSDALLVLSSREARHWRQFCPTGMYRLVKNPFDLSELSPATSIQPSWTPPRGRRVILFVGRLIRQKGVYELLDAVEQLTQDLDYHVLIAGEGPEEGRLRARTRALGLANRVSFTGYLDRATLAFAYARADVLACPSWSEGFPTVVAEAMHAGLPIVTTREGGMDDHLIERQHALLVPVQNPDALADALRQLLTDERLRRDMSARNKAKIQEFSPDLVATEYLSVLREVAALG
jgi:glycosyltransferase involved in cell wall biosynthesis